MDIEVYMGSTKAIISTHGGYVTNLSDDRGDILFPKRTLTAPDGSEKVRGGCHVCMPNFGPGGESGLAQHGYGRTSEWVVRSHSETRVELVLAGKGDYIYMESSLTYEIQEGAFQMALTLKNTGSSPLNVSPGFHPYFFTGGKPVSIDSEQFVDLAEFAGTKFVEGTSHELVMNYRHLTLASDTLATWAEWTDGLGDYFCVEPTQNGNAFAEDMIGTDTLTPGEVRSYRCSIVW